MWGKMDINFYYYKFNLLNFNRGGIHWHGSAKTRSNLNKKYQLRIIFLDHVKMLYIAYDLIFFIQFGLILNNALWWLNPWIQDGSKTTDRWLPKLGEIYVSRIWPWAFSKCNHFSPWPGPYPHEKIYENLFITFGVMSTRKPKSLKMGPFESSVHMKSGAN